MDGSEDEEVVRFDGKAVDRVHLEDSDDESSDQPMTLSDDHDTIMPGFLMWVGPFDDLSDEYGFDFEPDSDFSDQEDSDDLEL